MNKELYNLHIKAGWVCGSELTCNGKVDYQNPEKAELFAEELSLKHNKKMEAYPCSFCHNWHIGDKIEDLELKQLAYCFDDELYPIFNGEAKVNILFEELLYDFYIESLTNIYECWDEKEREELFECVLTQIQEYRNRFQNIF